MRLRSALYLVATLALGACSRDVVAPNTGATIAARYVLATGNGAPLPFVLWSEASGASATLLGETLTFARDGHAVRERTMRLRDARGGTTTETTSFDVEYRLDGTHVEIGWFTPCPPNANCIGNDDGSLTLVGVELTSRLYYVGNAPAQLRYIVTRVDG